MGALKSILIQHPRHPLLPTDCILPVRCRCPPGTCSSAVSFVFDARHHTKAAACICASLLAPPQKPGFKSDGVATPDWKVPPPKGFSTSMLLAWALGNLHRPLWCVCAQHPSFFLQSGRTPACNGQKATNGMRMIPNWCTHIVLHPIGSSIQKHALCVFLTLGG